MGWELVINFRFSISEGKLKPVEACPVESPLVAGETTEAAATMAMMVAEVAGVTMDT